MAAGMACASFLSFCNTRTPVIQPTLRTSRFLLRPFSLDDATDVQRLAGDRAVAEFGAAIPYPYLDGMAKSWIMTHRKAFAEEKLAVFAVTLETSGVLVGAMSLIDISRWHRRAELGYWIGRDYWNNGYATEAASRVIDFGFAAFGLNRIHARCLKRNAASARTLEKVGMRPEGCLREHECKNGRLEDILLYGLLKSDVRLGHDAL